MTLADEAGRYPAHIVDAPVPALMNPVLDAIERRTSTRAFTDEPVSDEQRQAILHAASRAPSAGAMMFYSMIVVDDPAVRAELCRICDDQPFMLKAPLWVLFACDTRKWQDLYERVGCYDDPELASSPDHAGYRRPGMGDFLLGCQDAMCAAQTAVIAAESLGIGSCYIGDVIERGEQAAELLGLPPATVPLSLLVFGHKRPAKAGAKSVSCTVDDMPAAEGASGAGEAGRASDGTASAAAAETSRPAFPQTPHPVTNLVMQDRYVLPDKATSDAAIAELDAKFTPRAIAAGAPAGERVRKLYHRKHTSEFMAEMNRSAAWWLRRWHADGKTQD